MLGLERGKVFTYFILAKETNKQTKNSVPQISLLVNRETKFLKISEN